MPKPAQSFDGSSRRRVLSREGGTPATIGEGARSSSRAGVVGISAETPPFMGEQPSRGPAALVPRARYRFAPEAIANCVGDGATGSRPKQPSRAPERRRSLLAVAVAQSRLGKAAARSRQWGARAAGRDDIATDRLRATDEMTFFRAHP